jgi:hypothetical protein
VRAIPPVGALIYRVWTNVGGLAILSNHHGKYLVYI